MDRTLYNLQPMPPVSSQPIASDPAQPWILIVDDDAPLGEMIVTAFASEPERVVHTLSGEAALQELSLHAREPVMAIVDVLMPGMDGFALTRKLHARLKRTKFVIISGHVNDHSWWPVDLRETSFLPKPFRLTELLALLQEAREEQARQR